MTKVKTNKAMIKYLPVEGEIEVGDKVSHDSGGVSVCETKEQEEYYKDRDNKKLKPFVVTQNIKVGDEIFDITDKGTREGKRFIVEKDEGDCWMTTKKTHNHCVTKKSAYKILGEVSQEATFVEDGKEYEVIIGWDGWYKPYWEKGKFQPVVCRVKCPTCKNFH